ncbi:30 kDa salivary gland allergen Aed a 3-like [Macrobrachium rosenbergii]|uniref:30 kDa salivary gland allergen Aed a 3-like n=1 Tax=Macrobrachium rosenbergii TaxID=79674 RepID=UPI0034D728D7
MRSEASPEHHFQRLIEENELVVDIAAPPVDPQQQVAPQISLIQDMQRKLSSLMQVLQPAEKTDVDFCPPMAVRRPEETFDRCRTGGQFSSDFKVRRDSERGKNVSPIQEASIISRQPEEAFDRCRTGGQFLSDLKVGRDNDRQKSGRQDARVAQEDGRQDARRQELGRQDARRQESGRQDARRHEVGRQDARHQESGRQDARRQEAGRHTLLLKEDGRQDTRRHETGHQDAERQGDILKDVATLVFGQSEEEIDDIPQSPVDHIEEVSEEDSKGHQLSSDFKKTYETFCGSFP